MKRLILILMAAAFVFSPMWVSQAEAGQGKHAARHHALVKQRALAKHHARAKHRALARHHGGKLLGKHHKQV